MAELAPGQRAVMIWIAVTHMNQSETVPACARRHAADTMNGARRTGMGS